MTWAGMPHKVSEGLQETFELFTTACGRRCLRWPVSSAADFKRMMAQVIIFRAVQSLVRPIVPAFQANITAYTVALMAEHLREQVSLENIWAEQNLPVWLSLLATSWAQRVDHELRARSNGRMLLTWARRPEFWDHMRQMSLPELQLPGNTGPLPKRVHPIREWTARRRSDLAFVLPPAWPTGPRHQANQPTSRSISAPHPASFCSTAL